MLMRALRIELDVAGQVDLAVFADDRAGAVDEHRGVEVPAFRRQLGVAEAHGKAERARALEQGRGLGRGQDALEPGVRLGAVLMPPAREEGGEREFRIDHEGRTLGVRGLHQPDHPGDHARSRFGFLDRPELGCGDADGTRHAGELIAPCGARDG